MAEGIDITGNITFGQWETEVNGAFAFGPGSTNSFDGNTSAAIIEVSSIPAAGTIYNGHIIATANTDEAGTTANAMLMSIKEWNSLTSANYTDDPLVAARIAEQYVEGELTDWTIPTTEEARQLKEKWGGEAIETINTTLANASLTPLTATDSNGNVRYLCNDALTTFSFSQTGSFTAAGKTVKTYRLRLVKKVKFVKK